MHVDRINDRVALRLGRVFGSPSSPVPESQVVRDIRAGRERQLASERESRPGLPPVLVTAEGRVRTHGVGVPIPILPRGSFPPEWLD